MKIVALHTDFRIYWPARLKALNACLNERGDRLEVIEIAGEGSPYSFAEKKREDEISWHILFPEAKPEDLSGKKIQPVLFELLDEINPDVILAGAIAFQSGALAVKWGNSRNNKRVIIFDDAKMEAVIRNPMVNFIKRNIYSGVDAMMYPAEPWISTGQYWGFSDDRMFFGVDVVDNKFWTEKSNEKPYEFDYFLAVGRQIEKKNYFIIVEAYKKYLDTIGKDKANKLVLVGDGPEHGRILDFISSTHIEDMVVCMPFQSQEVLRGIYQNAHLLCSSSNSSETWGLVINEAMCGGCAIIASKECGASETLVKPGVNGYIISCFDVDAIAASMVDYHRRSPVEKESMSLASCKIVSEWGLERFCEGVVDACDYVVSHEKRKKTLISRILIPNWYGRYNPV